MARADNDLTAEQWSALRAAWSGCAYCGAQDVPLQKDCVLPLSRGGRYTLDNVVPACRSCNASKCNQEVTHWLRVKRLDEAAFLLRHQALSAELVRAERDRAEQERADRDRADRDRADRDPAERAPGLVPAADEAAGG